MEDGQRVSLDDTASVEVSRKVVAAEGGGGGVANGGRNERQRGREGGKAGRRTLSLSQVYDRLENAKLARSLERARERERENERRRRGWSGREKEEKKGDREVKEGRADRARAEDETSRTRGQRGGGRREGRFNAAIITGRSTKWRVSRGPLDNGPSATCSRTYQCVRLPPSR